MYITPSLLSSLQERLTSLAAELHDANPLKPGIEKEALRQRMDAGLGMDVFEALLRSAVSAGMLEVEAGKVRIAGKGRSLSREESAHKDALLRAIREGEFSPPLFKEMMERSGMDKNKLRDILGILLEDGEIEQVNPDYFLARGRIAQAEERIRSHLSDHGTLEVSDVRDMLGASRKYAIPLLEYLDRKRVTRRDGDRRILY